MSRASRSSRIGPFLDAALWGALVAGLGGGCWADLGPVEPAGTWLDADTVSVAPPADPDPGAVTLRRLNRLEFDNTLRDLFATERTFSEYLPPDDTGYGFDNIGDVLTLSPVHLEGLERAAREAVSPALVALREPSTERIEAEVATSTQFGVDPPNGRALRGLGAVAASFDVALAGRYELRVRVRNVGSEVADDEPVTFELAADWFPFVEAEVEPDGRWRVESGRVDLSAGPRQLGVVISGFDGPDPPDPASASVLEIDWFELHGPLAEPSEARRAVLDCAIEGEDHAACAAQTIARFGRRAWRRPLEAGEQARLEATYAELVDLGLTSNEALSELLQGMLLSPHFLFRVEPERPAAGEEMVAIGAFALASRLSYFLWASMPDETLLDLAETGELLGEDVIEAQVRRIIRDPRARALVDGFAAQWLNIRALDLATPDPVRYPEWTGELRDSMRAEMERFFEGFVTEGRDMRDLLMAEEVVIDQRLADLYGLAGPRDGQELVVRPGAPGSRGGLLTQAGLLTTLSTPVRTSISRRGAWVLGHLLCAEPGPPPPGVTQDLDDEGGTSGLSIREQLAAHSADPGCASCHDIMDNMGIGLERYDAIGRIRDRYPDGTAIDDLGEIDGMAFRGASQLAQLVADDPRFADCIVENVLTYALGRGTGRDDRIYIREISDEFVARGRVFEELAVAIATSEPFRYRGRGEGGEP
jgi:hypothetical protein